MIDTKLFANPVTIRALFDDLHNYKTSTLANAIISAVNDINAVFG